MSRSKRRTPIIGYTSAETEKQDKRRANRALRRKVKVSINQGDFELPLLREVSTVWSFDKDGKQYLINPSPQDMRK